jgi:5'(3')-deoxyribonucleotidase
MAQKIVSIDIDEVLRAFVKSLQNVYRGVYPNHRMDAVVGYSLHPYFEIGKGITKFYSEDFADLIYIGAEFVEGAKGFTDELMKLGHLVILNTSQPNTHCDELAVGWLVLNKVKYDGIFLSQDKGIIHPAIHLDDATHNLIKLREQGIRAVAFDTPWNQTWDGERVYTHKEFVELCEEL